MGKSTASRWLAQRGWKIVDADVIGHSVLEPGTGPYNALVEAFGAEAVCQNEERGRRVDRASLGRHVFGNRERLRTLNKITHPAIGKQILAQVFWGCLKGQRVVVDAALLPYSVPLRMLCGPILAVVCSPSVQRERLKARDGLSDEEVDVRLASQGPLSHYTSVATKVFRNDGTPDMLAQQLETWYSERMW